MFRKRNTRWFHQPVLPICDSRFPNARMERIFANMYSADQGIRPICGRPFFEAAEIGFFSELGLCSGKSCAIMEKN